MDVHVTLKGRGDLTARIYRQLFDAVLDGRLRPGERLPPTRELARRLDISRNTVALAYERLVAEGVLTSRIGAGTFVCTEAVGPTRARRAPAGSAAQARSVWKTVPEPPPAHSGAPLYDFRVGSPDATMFPFTVWRRLVARQLRPGTLDWARYGEPSGHIGVRAAIARHIGISRSVRASADDVIVTQGAQQALDLIGRVVLDRGDTVAVEEPGYSPARLLFRTLGARVIGVPVDGEGLMVSAIPKAARLVYVTPSTSFRWVCRCRCLAAGTPDMGGATERPHHRRRLRQRIPIRGTSARSASDVGRHRAGYLRRLVFEGHVANTAPWLPDRASFAPRGVPDGQAADRLAW